MIKINLIPYREQRKKEEIFRQLTVGLIPVAVMILVVLGLWLSIRSDISHADSDIAALNQKIKQSKVKMKEIKAYKKKKKQLTKKMEIIATLQKGKAGPVHLLDDMASAIPGELWLTDVKQKGMNIEIEGTAFDNFAISNYMVRLENSPSFKDIDLKQVKTAKRKAGKHSKTTLQLKRFVITGKIVYTKENND